MEAFAVTAKVKGLTLSLREMSKPVFVRADSKHVKRILINLVSNAIKYTVHGGVDIWVESLEPGKWSIMLRDTGIGMNAAQLEQLFTPFTRFHTSIDQGFGLGLALSKILAQASGADIKVTSQEGQGSVFEFQLSEGSAYLAKAPAGIAMPLQKESSLKSLQGPKILLVDDNPDCLQSQAKLLESIGYQIYTATSVAEALALVNYDKIEFIITDACMPDAGGRELLERLAERSHRIPVLVVTGLHDKEEQFLKWGASRVLEKPADLGDILQWIDDCGASESKRVVNG